MRFQVGDFYSVAIKSHYFHMCRGTQAMFIKVCFYWEFYSWSIMEIAGRVIFITHQS